MKDQQKETESLQNTLAEHAENANIKAENSTIILMMSSAIATSPIIDKFSTWLLAGCGATAALMITNMNAIIPLIGDLEFKLSIYLLIASALAGLLQKYKFDCFANLSWHF